jgi:NADPH-dependent 2,4-dienoyl-CoA reductase/sulfur reductase-like enzyme
MKLIVLGGSNAGFAAVNAFRNIDKDSKVVIYEKLDTEHPFISAGIKLALAGKLEEANQIHFEHYDDQTNTDYQQGITIERIDAANKTVYGRNNETGQPFTDTYDKLIYAFGSSPRVPAFVGSDLDRVVFVKDEQDANEIKEFAKKGFGKKHALVYGGGPVGVELANALQAHGVDSTFVTRSAELMPNYYDEAVRTDLEHNMSAHGVRIKKGLEVSSVATNKKKITVNFTDGSSEEFDFMAIAAGLQPNTALLASQVKMSPRGAILVNDQMQTSDPDIYAIGDAGLVDDHNDQYFPLMSAALRMGRVAGYVLGGMSQVKICPILRTMGFKVFDRMYYKTGLTLAKARANGYPHAKLITLSSPSTLLNLGGEGKVIVDLIFDLETGTTHGAQISTEAVAAAELITVFAHAIADELTVEQMAFTDMYFEAEMNMPYSLTNRIAELAMIERHRYKNGDVTFNTIKSSYYQD